MKALILAAGRGSRMQEATDSKPKCLVELNGKALLLYQISALKAAGIERIGIVVGYKKECLEPYVKAFGLKAFENPKWNDSNMIYSLACAKEWLLSADSGDKKERIIVSYSDIFYESQAIKLLQENASDMAITYSSRWRELWEARFSDPLSDAESFREENGILQEIGKKAGAIEEIQGQYMGLLGFSQMGLERFFHLAHTCENPFKIDSTSLLQRCIDKGEQIAALSYGGIFGECDNQDDITLYENIYKDRLDSLIASQINLNLTQRKDNA